MVIQTSDGIDIYCLPECAKCKLTGEHVEDMDECPCCDSGICTPDTCYNYFEDWEEQKEIEKRLEEEKQNEK